MISKKSVVSILGTTLTIKSYGSVEITASQNGNTNYEVATPVVVDLMISLDVEALRKGENMLLINNVQEQFVGYQWYQNDKMIAGEAKQYYYSKDGLAGEYYCMVSTERGDQFMSNTITTSSPKSIAVYPSPAIAGGNINIELKGFNAEESEDCIIHVYSITGNLIQKIIQPQNVNNLTIQKPGIYIIKSEGGVNFSKKIIVK